MKKQTKQIKKTNKKHESGRSMIEMVGVLAVMGLITAAAFVLITSAMSSQRISRIDDDMSAIVQGVRLLYNPSDNFYGVDDNALKVLGFKDTKNPYGGGYSLSTPDVQTTYNADGSWAGGTLPDAAKFKITITGVGNAICNTLKSRAWAGGGHVVVDGDSPVTSCGDENNANQVVIEYGKTDNSINQ